MALHINELIEQRNMLKEAYNNIIFKSHHTLCQSKASCPISDQNALECYKFSLFEEYILNAIINKNNEIQIISNYYTSSKKATFLNQCCSIFDLINQEKEQLTQDKNIFIKEKKIISQNIASVEEYLRDKNVSTKEFVLNIKKALDAKQKEINKKSVHSSE